MKKNLLLFALLLLISGVMLGQEGWPSVTTSPITDIQQTTATGGGTVTDDGGAEVTERGVCWSTSNTPDITGSHLAAINGGVGEFSVYINNLTAGTHYFVRAYATNSAGTAYGDVVEFTTLQNAYQPTVTTAQVTNITQTTATGGGTVTDDGGAEVTERGVCWSTSHNPTTSGSHSQASTGGTGSFTCNMTGLTAGTTYYVRAYAKNSAGTAYGSEVSFVTPQSVVVPSVTTNPVTNITQTTATGGGTVTSDGGAEVTERGICWSTSHNPNISNTHATSGQGTGSFTCNITGLTPSTTYYVRAYAKNSVGVAYGTEVSFTTLPNPPTVSPVQITDVTQTTAKATANVTNGNNVTERGVCWSTSHNPTINNSHASSGSGSGTFSVNLTGLTPGTTYFVRAYAIYSAGVVYSSEVSFTTLGVTIPTVTTSQVTNITQTSATGGGEVTSDGGATVTERGICWSMSPDPTVSGLHQSNGNGLGTFIVEMSNLTSDTTYYVRAYAKNSVGVAYGNEVHFKTSLLPLYDIKVIADPREGGEVSGGGTYQQGQTCEVIATANSGYNFINWTKNNEEVSTNLSYTFTVTELATYIAHFQSITYTVNVASNPSVGGIVSIDGESYHYGDSCTIIAMANSGYQFINWTENGETVSEDAQYTFPVYRNYNLVANFSTTKYYIAAVAEPDYGGTVSGYGEFAYNAEARLQATANQGFTFTNWTENGTVVCSESDYIFTVTSDRNLEANFTSAQFSINVETSEGGSILVDHDEATAGTAITITVNANAGYELDTITVYNTDNPLQTVQVTNNELNYEFTMPNYSVTVKAEFKQQEIDTPAPICSGESLDLDELVLPWFPHGYWQLSPTEDFEQGSTIIYTNQALDASYNGWYLRYHGLLWNSNIVPITVYSMAEMTLEGEESASLDQEVEYIVVIEGQDNYADYSFNWSVSDEQAEVTILDNSCKVTWKTTGTQQVSVTVTDETTGCTNLLVKDVNVTACIDNLQEIVAKDHKDGSETYVLILVYPNPNNEDYTYQWLYSSNDEIYHELTEGTAKKQYYYKGGRIKDGYYKVRISKDGCSEETLPYHVNDGGRLHIYPNPSHRGTGVVVVNDSDSPAQLTIYSTDGRVLHTQTVTSDQATIGINLPQGVYVAYLITSDGYTKIGKLIIQ